jgi:hypothetical protein
MPERAPALHAHVAVPCVLPIHTSANLRTLPPCLHEDSYFLRHFNKKGFESESAEAGGRPTDCGPTEHVIPLLLYVLTFTYCNH